MNRAIGFLPMILLLTIAGCSSEPDEQAMVAKPFNSAQPRTEPVDEQLVRSGAQIYQRHCQACHDPGAGHPATLLLGQKYGAEKAVIKGRKELNLVYVKTIVRGGLLEMPPFRPTEITDAELDVIAEFIIKP